MTMTRTQVAANAESWVDWWKRRGIDTVACLTVDEKKFRVRHHAQLAKSVATFMAKQGYRGDAEGVVDIGVDGNWHAHLAFQSGHVDNEKIRSAWYLKNGKAMVRTAGSRSCADCTDRPSCSWRKFNTGGCGDLEYIARKLHLDRRDGGAIIEINARPNEVSLTANALEE